MKVVRLTISNFRGIKSAELLFDGHTLMVGSNNVGKSTLCEALDLVLGPDRLNRFPPVDELDFYNAEYLAPAAEEGHRRGGRVADGRQEGRQGQGQGQEG